MPLNLKPVEDFPHYVVSDEGVVFLDDFGRLKKRKHSSTRDGLAKITLYKHGVPYTRSLPLIVATAHVYNDYDPEIFNTPIHLDNDLQNNMAENLAWRPRWFSLKYQRQYWNEEYRFATTLVLEEKSGEVYTLMAAAQTFGVLCIDILNSCSRGEPTFPNWRRFSFV